MGGSEIASTQNEELWAPSRETLEEFAPLV